MVRVRTRRKHLGAIVQPEGREGSAFRVPENSCNGSAMTKNYGRYTSSISLRNEVKLPSPEGPPTRLLYCSVLQYKTAHPLLTWGIMTWFITIHYPHPPYT